MQQSQKTFASRKLVITLFLVLLLVIFILWWWRPVAQKEPAYKGVKADQISIRSENGVVQYKILDGSWQDIVALSTLKGEKGETGARGPQGEKGDKGDTGAVGPQGTQGAKGDAGQNGREIELRKDVLYIQWRYVGDSSWNNLIAYTDLKGEKGDQGEKGEKGDTGAQGAKGNDGAKGEKGEAGLANNLQIGKVSRSECVPSAEITGAVPNQTLNLNIPGTPVGGKIGQVLTKNSDSDCDASWKDTYEIRGAGSPEGKVAAKPGTYYTDTDATLGAIRWVKEKGAGNTGWKVIFGDTGWREVTDLALPDSMKNDTGKAYVRRINQMVYMHFVITKWGNSWSAAKGLGNRGFDMQSSSARKIPLKFGEIGKVTIRLAGNGGMTSEALGEGTTTAYQGVQTFAQPVAPNALPWPTELPGIPYNGNL